ncbi:MAG TPA: signal recognition particle protein [Synergistales bacterium]|nr:signal recognition particle protein [Synergistales bacterium]
MFEVLRERLESIFDNLRGKGKLTEEDVQGALREVRRALLEADVDYKVVKAFVEKVRERAVGQEVLGSITPAQQVIAIVYDELVSLMGREGSSLKISPNPPTIYMMVGLQGSGKTTTAVKLAHQLKKGHKPMVVACDLRRPAAVDQLRILAAQAKVDFYGPSNISMDLLDLAREALKHARNNLIDVIIFDTAGRIQIDEEMMDEVVRLSTLLSPHETLLVVDSMTGQEAVKVASAFHDRLLLTGLILSKLDGDARGGAALAIKESTGISVKFAGTGEDISALEPFDAQRMSNRILGMGDVAGLAEKVKSMTSAEDVQKISLSLKKNRLTMEDLLIQFEQLEKMGPLDKVLDMLPGAGKLWELKNADIDSRRMKQTKAIIQSMTVEERRNPQIIKGSRRRRIANGSGTSVQMVNQLLKQHTQMNQLWKQFGKNKNKKGFKMPGGMF